MLDGKPLPPKLYFRIGEVADLVGVEPHVLRYWEREFRSIRPSKSAKGQRVYSRRDVENLMRVRELLYTQGFTIAGARKRLQRTGGEPVEAPANDVGSSGEAGTPQREPPAGDAATGRGPSAGSRAAGGAFVGGAAAEGSSAAAFVGAGAAGRSSAATGEAARGDGAGLTRVRAELRALRAEVTAFLEELGPRAS